jgi:hypothetical protein
MTLRSKGLLARRDQSAGVKLILLKSTPTPSA